MEDDRGRALAAVRPACSSDPSSKGPTPANRIPVTPANSVAGISPRADYIDCPVGDLIAGAGGSFPVTFTVPNDAATTGPNNVINNGDYDIRASTVSPFIGPLVKQCFDV